MNFGLGKNKAKSMKNVLVIYYTQSGQLLEISKNITSVLETSEKVNLVFYEIKLKKGFPFPWNRKEFYHAFPETYLQVPSALDDLDNSALKKKYDLVIISYQIWFLTPSIPINSFLKTNEAEILLKDTPVITVIGCRNMWVMAHEKMKQLLVAKKAKLVGNIALVDRHINHISVITIVHWMFSGVKKRYLGIFPRPGVSDKDIDESSKFGPVILNNLFDHNFDKLQVQLLEKNAVKIKPFLVLMDKRANVIFGKWANLISKKGASNSNSRDPWIRLFNIYLLIAIWLIAPIVFVIFLLTYAPLKGRIKREKQYYSSIDLKKN